MVYHILERKKKEKLLADFKAMFQSVTWTFAKMESQYTYTYITDAQRCTEYSTQIYRVNNEVLNQLEKVFNILTVLVCSVCFIQI